MLVFTHSYCLKAAKLHSAVSSCDSLHKWHCNTQWRKASYINTLRPYAQ